MKQIIFRLLFTAIIIIALIQSGVINALFMFFIAGTLPGTDYVVPANIMMLAYCAMICAVALYAAARTTLHNLFTSYIQSSKENIKTVQG
ncbi:MAG TPA: hypothetical protein VGO98_01020 [Candidatus Saccharimonadales bacterium]|nr:hypothetical protein [Candidatus Saccharimonadales bacterium]